MFDLDYNLYERDGVVYASAYEVKDGKIDTRNSFFTEKLGDIMVEGFAEVLNITDWAGVDYWFTENEWHALTAPVFAKAFGLPIEAFGKLR